LRFQTAIAAAIQTSSAHTTGSSNAATKCKERTFTCSCYIQLRRIHTLDKCVTLPVCQHRSSETAIPNAAARSDFVAVKVTRNRKASHSLKGK